MIEIYVLFIYIPRKIRSLAKPRGQSALAWCLMAIGAWVGSEIAVFFILGMLIVVFPDLEKNGLLLFSGWLISFVAAGVALSLVIRQLRNMPVQSSDELYR